jgi:UDP-N-acetylglucosamine--N-acetylmuramyl-(pentapeptide) pyrophosphoryl-undecaprenol N-acetylglucosamine transferase
MDKGVRIIWQTGQAQYSDILSKITVKPRLRDKIELFPFTHNISSVYLRSDFAICRAGALSLAELEAYKIPAIIIPLPTSAANHQYHNALHQQNQNKGLLLEQNVQTEEKLLDTIDTLINNYEIFQKHLAYSIHATATENIVSTIINDFKSTNQ